MMRGYRHYKKPDPLLLLAAAVVLGAVMSSTANAGERDGFRLSGASAGTAGSLVEAPFGTHGARLQVSLTPPPEVEASLVSSGASQRELGRLSDIFLSLRYPW